jgi:glycosyltransferase involved in cell wall biosynthesis
MFEALSSGCLVLGSATAPVQEVIQDGQNGLLVDFFDPKQIAARIDEVFNHPTQMAELRQNARQTVLDRYDLKQLLPQHLKWMEEVMNETR